MLKYQHTGIISSHYVHFLLRKNLTYQNRSKYRSKTTDMKCYNTYLHLYFTLLRNFATRKNANLYKLSNNLSKRSWYTTESFEINNDG